MKALVHGANVQDSVGGLLLLDECLGKLPRLEVIWADSAYGKKPCDEWVESMTPWKLDIVRGIKEQKGFQVQPHRWIVERTFGWLGRYRRFSKDYEYSTTSSEAMIYIAMTRLMLQRLTLCLMN